EPRFRAGNDRRSRDRRVVGAGEPIQPAGAPGGPARRAAGARAGPPGHGLGPLGTGRGARRPDGLRVPLTYWFRVDAGAIENIPPTGGALLLANHGGAIPAAGAMIAKAIAAEHPRPRPLHLATDRALGGIPGLGMLAAKIGAVPAHPANLHRLLFDEQQV